MRDLDDDDRDPYPPSWHAGRPPLVTRGPVVEAYADTEVLEFDCPTCRQPAGEFCRVDGRDRRMPCLARINLAAAHMPRESTDA